jgi:hypothetical protein
MPSRKRISQVLLNITNVIFTTIFIISITLTSCGGDKAPTPDKSPVQVDPGKLAGSWLRPDGGYVIEILEVHDQGTLNARYLNPRPINIARAEWKVEDDRLKIFIKFDDVNYPGSTYTLDYFPDRDQLIGAYFQAVQQQSYYVEFIRQPRR